MRIDPETIMSMIRVRLTEWIGNYTPRTHMPDLSRLDSLSALHTLTTDQNKMLTQSLRSYIYHQYAQLRQLNPTLSDAKHLHGIFATIQHKLKTLQPNMNSGMWNVLTQIYQAL